MRRPTRLLLPLLLAAALTTGAVTSAAEAASFGPKVKQCGKLKKKAAKSDCKKENAAIRKAFAQIKDRRFTGSLFNNTTIDATFCSSGHWQILVGVSGFDIQEFKGKRWQITTAYARKNYLSATATGPSDNIYTRISLQWRGKKRKLVFSDGNPMLAAPPAKRTSAKALCRTL